MDDKFYLDVQWEINAVAWEGVARINLTTAEPPPEWANPALYWVRHQFSGLEFSIRTVMVWQYQPETKTVATGSQWNSVSMWKEGWLNEGL